MLRLYHIHNLAMSKEGKSTLTWAWEEINAFKVVSTGSKAVNDGFFIIIMSEKENKQPVLQEGVYSKKQTNKKKTTDLIIQLLFIVCISSQFRGKKKWVQVVP